MLQRTARKLYAALRSNQGMFRMRTFFIVLLLGLVCGLVSAALFFVAGGILFQENLLLFFVLLSIPMLLFPLAFFSAQRYLVRKHSGKIFAVLPMTGRQRALLAALQAGQEYPEFEEALLRQMEERRISREEEQRHRLRVAGRFGLYIPEKQLVKVLEDERFFALLGMEKEGLAVLCAVKGVGDEPKAMTAAASAADKIFAETHRFAKQQELLFSTFALSGSLLFQGLPYDCGEVPLAKTVKRAKKWCTTVAALLKKGKVPGFPVCLLAAGPLAAGLVESGSGAVYAVEGELLTGMRRFLETSCTSSGVYLHASLQAENTDPANPDWTTGS